MGLDAWPQHHGLHLLTLYPPAGGGRIRVYERLRPVLRASQVVQRVLDDDPAYRLGGVSRAQPFVTSDGEHGAWIDLQGTRDEASVRRAIAIIFADEFVVAFDILAIQLERWDELELTARELVVAHELGLGIRRRRYLYTPPPGWTGLARGLVGYFYPPGFPNDRAFLVVQPAIPVPEVPDGLGAELGDGLAPSGTPIDRAIEGVEGLHARHVVLAGTALRSHQPLVRHAIIQHAPPYLYVMRLDHPGVADDDEVPAVLAATARSIVPVPNPGARVIPRPGTAVLFDHWAD